MNAKTPTPDFASTVPGHVRGFSGARPENSTVKKFWTGMSAAVVDQLAEDWDATKKAYAATRQQAYFSAEFLQGRALLNNLTNLGLVEDAVKVAQENGLELSDIMEAEHDAALGNGGLG
ncbi:MAG: glycogen phosphorylase, partial [Corynebacterium sp.]|nr:glycogen phosphorylase [Corynebacterium sp.]